MPERRTFPQEKWRGFYRFQKISHLLWRNERHRMQLCCIATLFFTVACEDSGSPTPSTETRDITAPTVIATEPADGDIDVWQSTPVYVSFSEALLAESVNSESIYLSNDSGMVTSSVSYDPEKNIATLVPDDDLATETIYTLNIMGSIVDLSGIPLSPLSTSFMTDGCDGPATEDSSCWDLETTFDMWQFAKLANKDENDPLPGISNYSTRFASGIPVGKFFQSVDGKNCQYRRRLEVDTQVWVFEDRAKNYQVISFRGTTPGEGDLATDVRSGIQDGYHVGFLCAWESVASDIIEEIVTFLRQSEQQATPPNVYFTGHSLGGILAVIAADKATQSIPAVHPELDLDNVSVYTFGAPRGLKSYRIEGDQGYSKRVPNSWQIVARWDAVPHYLEGAYTHTGSMVVLTSTVDRSSLKQDEIIFATSRVDRISGTDYKGCGRTWGGEGKSLGVDGNWENHPAGPYTDRLKKLREDKKDFGIQFQRVPTVDIFVENGRMAAEWTPWQEVPIGPCDEVAIAYDDSNGDAQEVAREFALKSDSESKLTPNIPKGPKFHVNYENGLGRVIASKKYVPHTPTLAWDRERIGENALTFYWDVDDIGRKDFVAIDDGNDIVCDTDVWPDQNGMWKPPRRCVSKGQRLTYVTKAATRHGGDAKVLAHCYYKSSTVCSAGE